MALYRLQLRLGIMDDMDASIRHTHEALYLTPVGQAERPTQQNYAAVRVTNLWPTGVRIDAGELLIAEAIYRAIFF